MSISAQNEIKNESTIDQQVQDLIIVGATTSVSVKLIHAINRYQPQWNIVGVVDDDEATWGTKFYGYPVLGSIDMLAEEKFRDIKTMCFIYGGNIWTRIKVMKRLEEMNVQMASIVYPDADLEYVETGEGVVIQRGSRIQPGVTIGNHVSIGLDCIIGHDVTIEDYAWIGPRVTILGRTTIKKGATLGAGSIIKGRMNVGEYSLVGMGAVAMFPVPDNTTVMGNPAQVINKSNKRPRNYY